MQAVAPRNRRKGEIAGVQYLDARDGVVRNGEQIDARGVALEVHTRKESSRRRERIRVKTETVYTLAMQQPPVVYRPRAGARIREDIADIEIGARAFYLALLVEVMTIRIEVKCENILRH